jgi:RNA exonuclease 1
MCSLCRVLKRTIQQGSHDSVADARAAMELALVKIKNGPDFESGGGRAGKKLPEALAPHRRRCCIVDRAAMAKRYLVGDCSGVAVDTDADAVRKHACPDMVTRH